MVGCVAIAIMGEVAKGDITEIGFTSVFLTRSWSWASRGTF